MHFLLWPSYRSEFSVTGNSSTHVVLLRKFQATRRSISLSSTPRDSHANKDVYVYIIERIASIRRGAAPPAPFLDLYEERFSFAQFQRCFTLTRGKNPAAGSRAVPREFFRRARRAASTTTCPLRSVPLGEMAEKVRFGESQGGDFRDVTRAAGRSSLRYHNHNRYSQ